jgi:hypothetical protein
MDTRMNDNPYAGKFDARNFGGVMREIMIFRINQMGHVNTSNHFWQAQQDIKQLRAKLERVYNADVQRVARLSKQRKQSGDGAIELWMLGYAAYVLICEEGRRLDDVRKMSGPKLIKAAMGSTVEMIEASESLIEAWIEKERPEDEAHIWQMPYYFEKLSMPEDMGDGQ